jgi:hypothetical protein
LQVPHFERSFQIAAEPHVDNQNLKRYSDFVNRKVYRSAYWWTVDREGEWSRHHRALRPAD